MMYGFIDTTEQQQDSPLPAEALQINGEYIENLIEGYRTLSVQGREALSAEVSTESAGLRPGSVYISKKYPERVITVRYQLVCSTSEAFREAYNALASILDVEESELIFADEPDKYFIGVPAELEAVEPGRNAVTSAIQFICSDPFKYSVEEHEASVLEDGTIYCNYGGTFPAYPVLSAQFLQEADLDEDGNAGTLTGNGDCGYVAFFDEDEHILQFGEPEEVDGEVVPATQTLLAAAMCARNAWTSAVNAKYPTNPAAAVVQTGFVKSGTVGMAPFKANPDNSTGYFTTATSYGTGTKWHGPCISASIPADKAGNTGADNFMLQMTLKACIAAGKEGEKQVGGFLCFISDSSGNKLAGVRVFKNVAGTKGKIWFIVNGKTMDSVDIDFSYYNKYFGNNRAAYYKTVKKKKVLVKAVKANKVIKFTKAGSQLTISAGGIVRSYTAELATAARITYSFQAYGTKPALAYNGLYSWKLNKLYCDTWKENPNKFTANDLLEVDCSDGSVLLNGDPVPDLGTLGNDWEDFMLQPGENQIGWACSDWCTSPPAVGMRYREVFL